MTHRGPFQPLPFCDSVIQYLRKKTSLHCDGLWSDTYQYCHTGDHRVFKINPTLLRTVRRVMLTWASKPLEQQGSVALWLTTRLIHKCPSNSDFRWIGGNSLNLSVADFLYPPGLVVLDCSSPRMMHQLFTTLPYPPFLYFYEPFPMTLYKSLIYVQFGWFCSRNHLDCLVWPGSPLSSDVD